MISSMRKAAAVIQSATTAGCQGQLSMAIYHEKCVAQVMSKLTATKTEACKALLEWAKHEESSLIVGLYQKLSEVDQLWLHLHHHYASQYNLQRRSYKVIVQGEKNLAELKKHLEFQQSKVAKLRKQIENSSKSNKKTDKKNEVHIQKQESQQIELGKAISLEDKALLDFNLAKECHAQFKYAKVREAIAHMIHSSRVYHEACLRLTEAREKLFKAFLSGGSSHYTAESVSRARGEASVIIKNLANDLGLPHPLLLAEKGGFQMFDLPPVPMSVPKREIAKTGYIPGEYSENPPTQQRLAKRVSFEAAPKLEKDKMMEDESTYMFMPEREIKEVNHFKGFPPPLPQIPDRDDDSSGSDYEYTEPSQYTPESVLASLSRRGQPVPSPTSTQSPKSSRSNSQGSEGSYETTYLNMHQQRTSLMTDEYDIPEKVVTSPSTQTSSDEGRRPLPIPVPKDSTDGVLASPSASPGSIEDRRPSPIPEEFPPQLPARSVSLGVGPQRKSMPLPVPAPENGQGHLPPRLPARSMSSGQLGIQRSGVADDVPPKLPARGFSVRPQSPATAVKEDAPKDVSPGVQGVTRTTEPYRPVPAMRKNVKQARPMAQLPLLPTEEPVKNRALPPLPSEEPDKYHRAVLPLPPEEPDMFKRALPPLPTEEPHNYQKVPAPTGAGPTTNPPGEEYMTMHQLSQSLPNLPKQSSNLDDEFHFDMDI